MARRVAVRLISSIVHILDSTSFHPNAIFHFHPFSFTFHSPRNFFFFFFYSFYRTFFNFPPLISIFFHLSFLFPPLSLKSQSKHLAILAIGTFIVFLGAIISAVGAFRSVMHDPKAKVLFFFLTWFFFCLPRLFSFFLKGKKFNFFSFLIFLTGNIFEFFLLQKYFFS